MARHPQTPRRRSVLLSGSGGILQPEVAPTLDVISCDTSGKAGVPGGVQIASIPPAIHIEFVDRQNADVTTIMDIRAFPDFTGYAPRDEAWHAIDTSTYDYAPDQKRLCPVGYGPTPQEAIVDLLELMADEAECGR